MVFVSGWRGRGTAVCICVISKRAISRELFFQKNQAKKLKADEYKLFENCMGLGRGFSCKRATSYTKPKMCWCRRSSSHPRNFDSLLEVFRCAGPPGLDLRPDPDLGANPAAEAGRGGDGGRHGRRGSDGGLSRVGLAKRSDQHKTFSP